MENKKGPKLDIRHIRIINEVKSIATDKDVLVIGAGDCKKDYHLVKDGFTVYSTDYQRAKHFDDNMTGYFSELNYSLGNIFEVTSFPVKKAETVLCCEVLEHLVDYKDAIDNLLNLTGKRLIITVPWEKSFNDPRPAPEGHCNFWNDNGSNGYKDINEFKTMFSSCDVSIEKIRTKPEDVARRQFSYLIIVDKK